MFDSIALDEYREVQDPAELKVESIFLEAAGTFRVKFRGIGTRWVNVTDMPVFDVEMAPTAWKILLSPHVAKRLHVMNGHVAIGKRIIYHAQDLFDASTNRPIRADVGTCRLMMDLFGKS